MSFHSRTNKCQSDGGGKSFWDWLVLFKYYQTRHFTVYISVRDHGRVHVFRVHFFRIIPDYSGDNSSAATHPLLGTRRLERRQPRCLNVVWGVRIELGGHSVVGNDPTRVSYEIRVARIDVSPLKWWTKSPIAVIIKSLRVVWKKNYFNKSTKLRFPKRSHRKCSIFCARNYRSS